MNDILKDFPSIPLYAISIDKKDRKWIYEIAIRDSCLDKQRVKEAIEKHIYCGNSCIKKILIELGLK